MGNRYSGTSYEAASKWLEGGRYENYRPTGSSNTYLARVDEHSIAVVLHYTPIVTYHDDGGTQVIYMGGWNTPTTRKRLREFCKADVCSAKGVPFLWTQQPLDRTPAKVQKCRTCHGDGKIPIRCWGPSWCYAWHRGPCEHGQTSGHKNAQCEHGRTAQHPNGSRECWRCEGVGRADYGSKPIYHTFNPHQAVKVDSTTGEWIADVDTPKRPSKDRSPRQGKPVQQPVAVGTIIAKLDPDRLVKATQIAIPAPATFPTRLTGGR